jgi:hypothetical protein
MLAVLFGSGQRQDSNPPAHVGSREILPGHFGPIRSWRHFSFQLRVPASLAADSPPGPFGHNVMASIFHAILDQRAFSIGDFG